MGNDLTSWRVTIGMHNSKVRTLYRKCGVRFFPFTNWPYLLLFIFAYVRTLIRFSSNSARLYKLNIFLSVSSILSLYELSQVLFSLHCCNHLSFAKGTEVLYLYGFTNHSYILFKHTLLLLSGDIERNPGPDLNATESCFSILHQNIRSIRNKLDYINDFFSDYDVLCFTETRLNIDIPDESLTLEHFDCMFRKDNSSFSGGFLVYTSSKFLPKRLLDLEAYLPESLCIEIKDRTQRFIICTVYRPPIYRIEFWERLNIFIEKALDLNNKVVLVGDINEDQLNISNHKFRDILHLNSMSNLITDATRVTQTTRTLIDPIAISENITSLNAGIFETLNHISDHYATYVFIKNNFIENTPFKRQVFNYKRADFVLLNSLIINHDWSFLQNGTLDQSVTQFNSKLLELVKRCIPTTLVTIRPNDKPWYNSEIRKTSRQRDRQKRKALNSGRTSDWAKYKSFRNKVNNMKKHAKETFFNTLEFNIRDLNANNPRLYWKTVKLLIKENSSSGNISTLTDPLNPDISHTSDQEKANVLNNFFTSISTIDDQNVQLPILMPKTHSTISNIRITENEVSEVLTNLQTNKATGPDEISQKILKETSNTLCNPLCTIFNRSIQEGKYPTLWKIANVMPLFKKGDKRQVSNYRPISLISCVGKVLERIVFKHLYNFLHTNDLIYKNQSGFLPGHSTVYQLIDIYNQICKSFDDRYSTCMVFL